MKSLKLIAGLILYTAIAFANATSDAGLDPKNVAECGPYNLYQYLFATGFHGIVHKEHRYYLTRQDETTSINLVFTGHLEGADLRGVEIYEYNPRTGASVNSRELTIVSHRNLFYMDILDSKTGKNKVSCKSKNN